LEGVDMKKFIIILLILIIWYATGLLGSYIAFEHMDSRLASEFPSRQGTIWTWDIYICTFTFATGGPLNFGAALIYKTLS